MIPCVSGLFIGIDRYDHFDEGSELLSSSACALKLKNYFKVALTNGHWIPVIENSEKCTNRSDIFKAINEWVPSVNGNTSGLIYFAGHGLICDEGMILCSSDYKQSIPFDSGVPIYRILKIIKKRTKKNALFMIIVDSCRAQHLIEIEEDIPANVCIIYSCRRGEYSVENGDNSAFFKSFMQGIQESQVIFHKNQEWCRLSELINHLKRKLDSIPKPNVQNADIYVSIGLKIRKYFK